MKRILLPLSLLLLIHVNLAAQSSSFIVLGDLHYDLLEDHDMEWLQEKPGDLSEGLAGNHDIT